MEEVAVKVGYKVMVCVALSEHVPFAPTTLYVIGLVGGVATTIAPVAGTNPVDGVQVYDVAPLAVIVTDWPGQSVLGPESEIVILGLELTVIVIGAELEQPAAVVPVTVYVVVPGGVAVTTAPVAGTRPVTGNHV